MIYAESSALYEGASSFPSREEDEAPKSFYAISKIATKLFADAYSRFSELNIIALRYFNVYGPRQDYRRSIPPLMCAIIIKLLKGEQPVIYGDGRKRRDFIYIDDVSEALTLAGTLEYEPSVLNIGSNVGHSLAQVLQLLRDITGQTIDITPAKPQKIDIPESVLDVSLAQKCIFFKSHFSRWIKKTKFSNYRRI